MRRRPSPAARLLRRLILVTSVTAAVAAAGYIGFNFWVNAQGTITVEPDEGEAVTVSGTNRRDNVFTLLVAATDEEQERTDSIMVVTFDMANKTADVLNIPRDTLVQTARTGTGKKINAAYGEGIETMRGEIQSVIGYRPDKYIILNFDGIASIIDSIGGIDYDVPIDMSYHDKSQNLSIEFKAGEQHLNGKQVVEFLRWRHNDDGTGYDNGDVGRVEKLQGFLKTLAQQIFTPSNLSGMPDMAQTVAENIDTDLTVPQLLWMGTQGSRFDSDALSMQTLPGDGAKISLNGSSYIWFYVADPDEALDQINNDGFNPFREDITSLDIVAPDTLQGAYSTNWQSEKQYRYEKERQSKKEEPSGSASTAEE